MARNAPISKSPQGQCSLNPPNEPFLIRTHEFVFPNAKDGPSGFAQGAIDEVVAFFVGGKFAPPEGAVVDGQVGMFGAGVPETAVHENCEPNVAL